MQELEDEPADVQNASPVEDEIKKAEKDAVSNKILDAAAKATNERKDEHHSCIKPEKPIPKLDCCAAKKQLATRRPDKHAVVYVHDPPCKISKPEIIPRHCFSKKEYIDFLATPKEKCAIPCEMRPEVRRVRTMPPRIMELARPMKRRVMMTLEEQSMNMTPEHLYNMVELLEGSTAFSPEQAENFVRDKAQMKKKKRKRKKEKSKCNKVKCSFKEVLAAGDPSLDLDAVNCQYAMAIRFVKSIFKFKCSKPREDYCDIATVILCRLSKLLEYTPIGNEDRKSQQMRILADIIACWILELLVEVSDRNKDKLEEECNKRRKELEDIASREATEDEEELELESDSDDSEDGDSSRKNVVVDTHSLAFSEETDGLDTVASAATQYEEEEKVIEEELVDEDADKDQVDDDADKGDVDDDDDVDKDGKSSIMIVDEGKDEENQTVECQSDYDRLASEQELARLRELEKSLSRMTQAFKSDIPFIDFSKICETIYCMIECDSENALNDPMDNIVHRVIYEKFEYVIKQDNPELLTEYMKDVVDVISGKIAKWLRKTLNDRQIKFLEETPPEVESKEVRDWSKWIAETAKMAEDWAGWINRVTDDVGCMKQKGKVTRGSWKDWTSKFEKNALLWRRTYLEAIHQEHHNTMMIANRKVCKTGQKKRPQFSEVAIKNTNFDSESKCNENF